MEKVIEKRVEVPVEIIKERIVEKEVEVIREKIIEKPIIKEIFIDKLVEVPIIKEKIVEKIVIDEEELNKQKAINGNLRDEIYKLNDSNNKYLTDMNNLKNDMDVVCSAPPAREIVEKEVIVEKPVIKEVIYFYNN